MTEYTELITRLRSTESRSKRKLLDEAADAIEPLRILTNGLDECKRLHDECDRLTGEYVRLRLHKAEPSEYEYLAAEESGVLVGVMQTLSCIIGILEGEE